CARVGGDVDTTTLEYFEFW
nr:immunoglobulin heavy chain junction region [Macaca mulatta]MOW46001.1 immunoglobulin heavy chain junction region [Macaca mulatta]MOW46176.1 immunoglobulin heavy chain junction region [Macaca mulatta]MOW47686.1 immunoglobulin heavy chain junction region [Macaca mulatta]MOW47829.1 immunoglobulin heavy chain junction region [Macaca mulatta]